MLKHVAFEEQHAETCLVSLDLNLSLLDSSMDVYSMKQIHDFDEIVDELNWSFHLDVTEFHQSDELKAFFFFLIIFTIWKNAHTQEEGKSRNANSFPFFFLFSSVCYNLHHKWFEEITHMHTNTSLVSYCSGLSVCLLALTEKRERRREKGKRAGDKRYESYRLHRLLSFSRTNVFYLVSLSLSVSFLKKKNSFLLDVLFFFFLDDFGTTHFYHLYSVQHRWDNSTSINYDYYLRDIFYSYQY